MQENESFELVKSVEPYRPYWYAGASGDFNPIHIDDNFAKAVGLPGKILQGLCSMAFCHQAVIDFAGGDPRRLKRIKVEFRGNVLPNDKVKVVGKVKEVGKERALLQFTMENQKGEKVIENGEAEVTL